MTLIVCLHGKKLVVFSQQHKLDLFHNNYCSMKMKIIMFDVSWELSLDVLILQTTPTVGQLYFNCKTISIFYLLKLSINHK